jgi:hypothetical protein
MKLDETSTWTTCMQECEWRWGVMCLLSEHGMRSGEQYNVQSSTSSIYLLISSFDFIPGSLDSAVS